jgi:hypothetical protein
MLSKQPLSMPPCETPITDALPPVTEIPGTWEEPVILRSGAAATKNLVFLPDYSEILRFAQNDIIRA